MILDNAAVDATLADLVKSTLALPTEGLKSMATGCPTVAGIYAGIVSFLYKSSSPQLQCPSMAKLVGPFLLFTVAGVVFGRGFLPDWSLLPSLINRNADCNVRQLLLNRQRQLRWHLYGGLVAFFLALLWSVVNVAGWFGLNTKTG